MVFKVTPTAANRHYAVVKVALLHCRVPEVSPENELRKAIFCSISTVKVPKVNVPL